ncbi:hypothetical protein [Secundilactobacillus kimchicus]|uniref:hypothetical protein n=1 Tax=Secundilactobacillus kimchicus TaxID=528209 RepID=UPI0024A93901|nr:hypothetical protein [Secundilactobacillus kimchicus]
MINLQTEQMRIKQLLRQDKQTEQSNEQYYQQALSYIREHLMVFYERYAANNQLSVAETAQRISKWDLAQWKKALNELQYKDWPDGALDNLESIAGSAGRNVRHMMDGIIALGVLSMFVKQYQLATSQVEQQGMIEVNRAGIKNVKDLVNIVTDPENATTWSSNLWSDSDDFTRDLQSVIDKKIRHGASMDDLVNVLVPHSKELEKPNTNAADRLAVAKRNGQRLILSETARVKDRVNMATFRQMDVKWVRWVCEPGACDRCLALEEGGPYPIDACPDIPDDSHPNCHCGKVPA